MVCLFDYDGDGISDVPVQGCTVVRHSTTVWLPMTMVAVSRSRWMLLAVCVQHNVAANTLEYGSCDFWSCYEGCTDVTACNYDAEALSDDGSCEHHPYGTDYDCDGNCLVDRVGDGVVSTPWDDFGGCSDPYACNFNPFCADVLGGSNCHYPQASGAIVRVKCTLRLQWQFGGGI